MQEENFDDGKEELERRIAVQEKGLKELKSEYENKYCKKNYGGSNGMND